MNLRRKSTVVAPAQRAATETRRPVRSRREKWADAGRRRGLAAFATVATLAFGSVTSSVGSAQAFGELTAKHAVVTTAAGCDTIAAGLPHATEVSGGCMLYDSADDTYFKMQAGGTGVKGQLHNSSGMVAKVEFHPLGDQLWVYDTKNDGDSIYVVLRWNLGSRSGGSGVITPPGTNEVVEWDIYALDIPEGAYVSATVYDSISGGLPTDRIGTFGGGTA